VLAMLASACAWLCAASRRFRRELRSPSTPSDPRGIGLPSKFKDAHPALRLRRSLNPDEPRKERDVSVIVLEPIEVNLLLSAAIDAGIVAQCDGDVPTPVRVTIETAQRFGKMILAENIRSHAVVYRSSVFRDDAGNRKRLEDYRFAYVDGEKLEAFARLAAFGDYQCSDSESYETSLAREFSSRCSGGWRGRAFTSRSGRFRPFHGRLPTPSISRPSLIRPRSRPASCRKPNRGG
jgi:hypothetical protein